MGRVWGGKQDHLETFINMPVFPRSPKDSRKIVKMKREVPVAQLFSREAPRVFAAKKKEEKGTQSLPRPGILRSVMKYIFIWPVKELLYASPLDL